MKFPGIIFFMSLALFLQCEKGVSEAQNKTAANAGRNTSANASPEPTKQNAANMNEIFNSKGKKEEIEYQVTGRLQKKGQHEGINYPNDNIVIEYELKNTGAKNIILFNRGHSGAGNEIIYAEPLGEGTVEISMKAFIEPLNKNCPDRFVAVMPRGSLLKAGETVKDKAYFELPLKTKTPFDDCEPKAEVAANASKVKFCLGFQEAPGENLKIDESGNVSPLPDIKNQRFICSDVGELR